jgi:transposase
MKVVNRNCAGLDVHKDEVVACVRRAGRGKSDHEVRRFATVTRGLLELSDWLEASGVTHVAMEATGVYWKPVWHVLEGRFELVLANAAHIRNVPGRKSDVNDATWIADLMAHGLIRSSFVPPAPIQELRDLTRTRKQLGREIVQHTQRLQKVLEDANIKLSSLITDVLGASGRRILQAIVAGESDPDTLAALGGPRLCEGLGRDRHQDRRGKCEGIGDRHQDRHGKREGLGRDRHQDRRGKCEGLERDRRGGVGFGC